MSKEKLNTGQKALQINLDAKRYGTFAEIGAGQEVARWFFHVGKASGTVATKQGSKPGQEEGQGWLGIKFQAHPHGDPSTIIIHVRMLDWETLRQQEAVGVLGVNLIHGAFYQHTDPASLIGSLLDGLTSQRVEVDMIKFSGPAFTGVDNRLMALQLVEQWLTEAAIFTADGETVIPGELLWKKPVLLERGSFRPLTNPMLDMLERAQEKFVKEESLQGEPPVVMFEMTLRQLQVGDAIDHRDFLDRVDTLGALGKPVLISNFLRYHRLVTYLARQTNRPIGLPIGLVRLRDVLDEKFYTDLPGGLMESLGQLFKNGAKLYVYPSRDKKTGQITTIENLEVAPNLRHLFTHLVENKFIENIANYNPDALKIYSGEVLAKIHSGDESLSQIIPAPIFEVIKAKKLFGWQQRMAGAVAAGS